MFNILKYHIYNTLITQIINDKDKLDFFKNYRANIGGTLKGIRNQKGIVN